MALKVLSVLGIILFIALLVMIVYGFLNDRPYSKLLIALFLPIIMIGLPSIKSLKASNSGIEFTTIYEIVSKCKSKENLKILELAVEKVEQQKHIKAEDFIAVNEAKILLSKEEKVLALNDVKVKFENQEQKNRYMAVKTAAEIQAAIENATPTTQAEVEFLKIQIDRLDTLSVSKELAESIKARGQQKIERVVIDH